MGFPMPAGLMLPSHISNRRSAPTGKLGCYPCWCSKSLRVLFTVCFWKFLREICNALVSFYYISGINRADHVVSWGGGVAEEPKRSLMFLKYYCSERISEVKSELSRLESEGAQLKAELDGTLETVQRDLIRRRRAYLKRRSDELKAERVALVSELERAADGLRAL